MNLQSSPGPVRGEGGAGEAPGHRVTPGFTEHWQPARGTPTPILWGGPNKEASRAGTVLFPPFLPSPGHRTVCARLSLLGSSHVCARLSLLPWSSLNLTPWADSRPFSGAHRGVFCATDLTAAWSPGVAYSPSLGRTPGRPPLGHGECCGDSPRAGLLLQRAGTLDGTVTGVPCSMPAPACVSGMRGSQNQASTPTPGAT